MTTSNLLPCAERALTNVERPKQMLSRSDRICAVVVVKNNGSWCMKRGVSELGAELLRFDIELVIQPRLQHHLMH